MVVNTTRSPRGCGSRTDQAVQPACISQPFSKLQPEQLQQPQCYLCNHFEATEAWVAVSCIASVVQLVDFTTRCISKSVELQQSGNGVLDSHDALHNVAEHLKGLKNEVDTSGAAISDPALHELCKSVTSATEDLLNVLGNLKVKGSNSELTSLRAAIRIMWIKEKIQNLEQRLSGFRDELNLHIVVRLRQQLSSMNLDLQSHIRSSDERTRKILDAILNQRDIFAEESRECKSHNIELHQATRDLIQEVNTEMRKDVTSLQANSNAKNQDEHNQTGHLVQGEAQRLQHRSEELQELTVNAIHSSETVINTSITEGSQAAEAEHAQTRSQIAELKASIRILADQIEARDLELKQLLSAFNETKSVRQRKNIGEKSNAVTAALLALETMYRTLLSVLATLESSATNLLNHARTFEIWKITSYASKFSNQSRPGYSSSRTNNEVLQLEPMLAGEVPRPSQRSSLLMTSEFAHDRYFLCYYTPVNESAHILDGRTMAARWRFDPQLAETSDLAVGYEGVSVDSGSCESQPLWLMAAVVVVLHAHLAQEEMVFTLFARPFDADEGETVSNKVYSSGKFSGPLRADMRYWEAFARSRGLGGIIDRTKVSPEHWPETDHEDSDDKSKYKLKTLQIRKDGPAWQIVEALRNTGLEIDWMFSFMSREEAAILARGTASTQIASEYVTVYCVKCMAFAVNRHRTVNGRPFNMATTSS